jgi:hypothetical protein
MKSVFFFIFFMVTAACIDPLNIKGASTKYSIVVDGMITDQPGPYIVKLFQTIPISDQLDSVHHISGATLKITDDAGGSETLTETQPGYYETAATVGTVGKTYTLYITTEAGDMYQSSPEKLMPVGDISNLRYEFLQTGLLIDHGSVDTQDGFTILLDAQLDPEQEGRVRWRWTGTFEVQTFPQLITKPESQNGQIVYVPNPPPCSGYSYTSVGDSGGGPRLVRFDTCTCCFCWNTQYSTTPNISDKIPGASATLSGVKIDFVQANKYYLYNKYVLEIEQLSCSPAVYEFWKEVNTQEDQGSDLFQTPPAVTGGNISATSSHSNPIIGIFGASAIKKQTITLTKFEVPYAIPSIDTLAVECFRFYPNSSVYKPSFW